MQVNRPIVGQVTEVMKFAQENLVTIGHVAAAWTRLFLWFA
jgi:hypothetical protein